LACAQVALETFEFPDLVNDLNKREHFEKLAVDLCAVARDIQAMIARRAL
jgi:hypothetical protein